jgi:hypothetical protein
VRAQRIPTTRTPPAKQPPPAKQRVRRRAAVEVQRIPDLKYTVAPVDQLSIDELRNVLIGVIRPPTLIKFSRMLTTALIADQERLNLLIRGQAGVQDIR